MLSRNTFRALVLSAAATLASVGIADAASVKFDVGFNTYVDCVRPLELGNIPLTLKGRMTLNGDGTAIGQLNMTAYRFISFKSTTTGRLGDPPMAMDGIPNSSVQLKVRNKNGLSLLTNFPNNTFAVHVDVSEDNKKCQAQLTNTLKKGKKEFNLFAGDTYFYCTALRITSATCKVR